MKLRLVLCLFLLTSPALANEKLISAFRFADQKNWHEATYSARVAGNALVQEFINWRRLKDFETRSDANEILRFVETHPDWPDLPILLDRAEESLLLEGVTWNQAKRWQTLHEALNEKSRDTQHKDPVAYIVKHGWVNGELTADEQKRVLAAYPAQIGQKEIARRVNRLLWNDQPGKARPLIGLIPRELQKVAFARIALQTNQFGIERMLSDLHPDYRNDPGVLYERMRWRARKQLSSGVREMLLAAPAKVPFAEKWWPYRAVQVREAIENREFDTALRLLENHGQVDDASLADALWLRGWLKMRRDRSREAYQDFYDMYQHVSFPISLSRGAYWAGLAAARNGNADIARNWFSEAAKHPTTFYGQLAWMELNPNKPLTLPDGQEGAAKNFSAAQTRMIDLIRLLARFDQKLSAEKFVQHLAAIQQGNAGNLHSLGRLAREISMPHLTVRVGKVAIQTQHVWLGKTSHPMTPAVSNAIEPALALAISRQESEFNPRARSSANALGLMQLLPSTASHTARRWGIPYSEARLYEAPYNMELGSAYLADMIGKFGGSYPLAIAAYNAGPGNVNKWIARYGRPPEDKTGLLNWLESIPFAETRNYVQRVLENLNVYRALRQEKEPLTMQRMLGR